MPSASREGQQICVLSLQTVQQKSDPPKLCTVSRESSKSMSVHMYASPTVWSGPLPPEPGVLGTSVATAAANSTWPVECDFAAGARSPRLRWERRVVSGWSAQDASVPEGVNAVFCGDADAERASASIGARSHDFFLAVQKGQV